MELLPDDMLANVLGRLPPCTLAASRCVRKHWCSVVDARRLLRADLLPLRLDAFFSNSETVLPRPSFFALPSAARRVGPGGRRLEVDDGEELRDLGVRDHCNGLILAGGYVVVNPATRQWVFLPDLDAEGLYRHTYLAYDPMVSPHDYQVVVIFSEIESDWLPSSPYTAHVFSSREWKWEERSFVLVQQGGDGEAPGTIAGMTPHQAVYFRGALYVQHQNDAVIRLALSDDKCQMIGSPAAGIKLGENSRSYLGKSEKGVYSAFLDWDDYGAWPQFRVWLLHEFCGQMEWVLKSNISLQTLVENFPFDYYAIDNRHGGPWINYETNDDAPDDATAQDDNQLDEEWDFDNGVILEATDNKPPPDWCCDEIMLLGFHPYKEIVFFLVSFARAVSYHLNTSKVQELGILFAPSLTTSFPYTACRFKLES